MKRNAVRGTVLAAAALLALGTVVPRLFAQGDPQPVDDPVEFSTWPGPSDADEPEGEIDLKNLDYPTTLGQPMLPSEEDPALQNDALTKPDDGLIYPLGLMASSKTLGAGVSEQVRAEQSSNAHYFSSASGTAAVVLVGVSADNACHFNFTGTGQCNYGASGANYKLFLDDLAAQGLNVMRLWVSIVGGDTVSQTTQTTCPGKTPPSIAFSPAIANHPELRDTDNPFVYDPSHGTPNGVGRWWLDAPNGQYFSRLAAVVNYANSKNIIVEVTLFSPLTGNIGLGPYGVGHAYKSDNTSLPGFTDTANFVNVNSSQYAAMTTYVFNVIHWTVDALYRYPNVYFEVANEPENVRLGTSNTGGCGNNSEEALNSPNVAKWQNAMANELRSYEARYLAPAGPLAHTHLVAVEPSTVAVTPPSTTFGAGAFVSGGAYPTAGNVVNSHYTLISPKGTSTVQNPLSLFGLGAIKMMQMYSSQPKVFGFNETKITGGIGGTCGGGGTGGSVAAGRAEAWEFLVNQGGVYNAFGYDCSGVHNCSLAANIGDPYCQIRIQMGVLRRFLVDPLVNVVFRTKASASNDTGTPATSGTAWINVGKYESPEAASSKFWAAFEPTTSATIKRWLVYIHHSKRSPTIDGGYTAVNTTRGYRETNLSVCLLGASAGKYNVRWYKNPESAVASAPSHFDMGAIDWPEPPPTTCIPGGENAVPLKLDPTYDYRYDYDLAILISK